MKTTMTTLRAMQKAIEEGGSLGSDPHAWRFLAVVLQVFRITKVAQLCGVKHRAAARLHLSYTTKCQDSLREHRRAGNFAGMDYAGRVMTATPGRVMTAAAYRHHLYCSSQAQGRKTNGT